MDMTRRQFIVLAATVTATGAQAWAQEQSVGATQPSATLPTSRSAEPVVDAGPLSDFQAQGVYDRFREQGFFIIHRDKQLYVLSSVCTHKGCKVRAQDDQSFVCKCHGSRFDPNGHVTKGPAQRDLHRLQVAQSNDGHLLVRRATG